MRTIKFRGYSQTFNSWLYGDLLSTRQAETIVCEESGHEYEVDPNSVGQLTGLHDKNGKEIYEGDILNVCNGSINGNGWFDKPYSVEFKCGKWDIPLFMWDKDGQVVMDCTHWCEVIGNIYENPELL